MKTQYSTTSIVENQALAFAPDARDKPGIHPLADPELERVAAAGRKPGVSGGLVGTDKPKPKPN